MPTIAEYLTDINNEKQALKTALKNIGAPMDNVPFTQYPYYVNLMVKKQ